MPIHPYFNLSGSDARGLLYGLLEVNKIQLRENPGMPSMRELVQSGKVEYLRADPNEHWQSYKEIVDSVRENGVAQADCEDLATAMAAEDQVRYGVLSLPYAYAPREGLFHVVTAVPEGRFGSIPQHYWPGAQFAPEIAGYVLQDPSVTAGMGRFGGLPEKEVSAMSSYGFNGAGRQVYGKAEAPLRQRRGLGGILGSFSRGLLGETSGKDVAQRLGSGARESAGIEDDWATQIGRSIPGRLGVEGGGSASAKSDNEAHAINALRKGAKAEDENSEAGEDEEMDDFDLEDEAFGRMWFEGDSDFDMDDDLEEMGFDPEELVGSGAWGANNLANRVADDMFGAVDNDVYTMGIFHNAMEGTIEDAEDQVQERGRGGSFSGDFSHLERPSHLRSPQKRPLATFGNMAVDTDDYGAFWHSKEKRKTLQQARHEKKLEKMRSKGQEDSPRFQKVLEKYKKAGGTDFDEESEDAFGFETPLFSSTDELFGEIFGDAFDEEDSELEDLEIDLEAEGF